MTTAATIRQRAANGGALLAEQACIGCGLIDPRSIPVLARELSAADFADNRHRALYKALIALHEEGVEPTPPEIARIVGDLKDVGGARYLETLIGAVLSVDALPGHAKIVRRRARREDLARRTGELSRVLADADDDWAGLSDMADSIASEIQGGLEADSREYRADGDPWQVRTLATAYSKRAPVQYVVDRLFPVPSLSLFIGPSGCLKSFLLADLCACVAAGRPWLEPLPDDEAQTFETLEAPVLWVNADNPTWSVDERFAALGRAYDLPPDAPLVYFSFPTPPLLATDAGAVAILTSRILHYGARLVVLDCLQAVRGDVDENSADMLNVVAPLRRVSEEANCAFIAVHHVNKQGGYRGSTSIENLVDFTLHVEREERAAEVAVRAGKIRHEDIPTFGARFTFDHEPGTGRLQEARFFGLPPEAIPERRTGRRSIGPGEQAAPVVAVLREEGALSHSETVAALTARLGCSERTAQRRLRAALDARSIRIVGGLYETA